MKRLYGLRRGDEILDEYFDDKKRAKARRKELGEGHFVTHGPDHWRGLRQDQNKTVGRKEHDA